MYAMVQIIYTYITTLNYLQSTIRYIIGVALLVVRCFSSCRWYGKSRCEVNYYYSVNITSALPFFFKVSYGFEICGAAHPHLYCLRLMIDMEPYHHTAIPDYSTLPWFFRLC